MVHQAGHNDETYLSYSISDLFPVYEIKYIIKGADIAIIDFAFLHKMTGISLLCSVFLESNYSVLPSI